MPSEARYWKKVLENNQGFKSGSSEWSYGKTTLKTSRGQHYSRRGNVVTLFYLVANTKKQCRNFIFPKAALLNTTLQQVEKNTVSYMVCFSPQMYYTVASGDWWLEFPVSPAFNKFSRRRCGKGFAANWISSCYQLV